MLASFDSEMKKAEKKISDAVRSSEEVRLLTAVPGLVDYFALAIGYSSKMSGYFDS